MVWQKLKLFWKWKNLPNLKLLLFKKGQKLNKSATKAKIITKLIIKPNEK